MQSVVEFSEYFDGTYLLSVKEILEQTREYTEYVIRVNRLASVDDISAESIRYGYRYNNMDNLGERQLEPSGPFSSNKILNLFVTLYSKMKIILSKPQINNPGETYIKNLNDEAKSICLKIYEKPYKKSIIITQGEKVDIKEFNNFIYRPQNYKIGSVAYSF